MRNDWMLPEVRARRIGADTDHALVATVDPTTYHGGTGVRKDGAALASRVEKEKAGRIARTRAKKDQSPVQCVLRPFHSQHLLDARSVSRGMLNAKNKIITWLTERMTKPCRT